MNAIRTSSTILALTLALGASPAIAQDRGGVARPLATARPAVDLDRVQVAPIDRRHIRPDRPDHDGNLRARLRNACFGPGAPPPVCRRVFGDHPGGRPDVTTRGPMIAPVAPRPAG
ncbi:hypothetical protein [Phenylobacterium sp.]|uniref:hypothetical protein n=1 Tax=Phenylobacterium sp. TaxID=1871053 RepID=UPI00273540FF|nr:hypothetical protein [Phenylobacterium sp.]MDP3852613.1 hypothetical protein [Phenylobacterium sp.]